MPFWLLSSNAHCEAGEDLPVPEKCSTSSTFSHFKIAHTNDYPNTSKPRHFIFNNFSGNLHTMRMLMMSVWTGGAITFRTYWLLGL